MKAVAISVVAATLAAIALLPLAIGVMHALAVLRGLLS